MKPKFLAIIVGLLLLRNGIAFGFLGVGPNIVELSLKPGEKHNGEFVITNKKDSEVKVSIEVQEWWSKQTAFEGIDPSKWLRMKYKKPFKIAPLGSKTMKYQVKMPLDAEGEMMAMVFFNFAEPAPDGIRNLEMRHGIPIYIVPKGIEKIDLAVNDCQIYMVNTSTTPHLEFAIKLENSGNVHTRPEGEVKIYDDSKNLVKTLDIQSGWPVFPGKMQVFYAVLKDASDFKDGRYQAELSVNFGKNVGNISGEINENLVFEKKNNKAELIK